MIRVRTAILCCVVIAIASAAWLAPRSGGAQAQTAAQLPALALGADDLPGYTVSSENPAPQANGAPSFARVLTSPSGGAVVSVTLVLATDAATLAADRATIADGSLLSGEFGAQAAFQAGQPNAVGEIDSSAAWQSTAADGTVDQVYGEAFLRGNIAAVIIASAAPDAADPASVAALAQQQDAKLLNATAAATPSATDAVASTPLPLTSTTPAPGLPPAPTTTPAPSSPTPAPLPAATPAPGSSPQPAAAPPPASLSTAQGLKAVALQQSDIPGFTLLGSATLKNPPAQILADVQSIWGAGNAASLQISLINDELTSLDRCSMLRRCCRPRSRRSRSTPASPRWRGCRPPASATRTTA